MKWSKQCKTQTKQSRWSDLNNVQSMGERRSNERRSERRSHFLSAELSGAQIFQDERWVERRSKYSWAPNWASAQLQIIFCVVRSAKLLNNFAKIDEQITFNNMIPTKLANIPSKVNEIRFCQCLKFKILDFFSWAPIWALFIFLERERERERHSKWKFERERERER